jgi:hypothetical protein
MIEACLKHWACISQNTEIFKHMAAELAPKFGVKITVASHISHLWSELLLV